MKFDSTDKIEFKNNQVVHRSAGGFLFFEEKNTYKLYVAILKKDDGKYLIPKGHIKKNENKKQAAERELKEELCINNNLIEISEIDVDSYEFNMPNDNKIHVKYVDLFVFYTEKKLEIKPLTSEGFIKAEWLEFYDAFDKLSFDKENLLKARHLFYYNKPIKHYKKLEDIKSILVGIPIKNGASTIYETLQSVINNLNIIPRSINTEIIICLDNCTDNTEDVIKDFIEKRSEDFFNINYIINNGLSGKSIVLNKIFEKSKIEVDFLCFIDDDIFLEKNSIINLLKFFVNNNEIRCAYGKWIRKKYKGDNLFKKFWNWLLGIKFEVQPYNKPSEFMRGSCMLFRRDNFVRLPENLFNDDQYFQYFYWPHTKEVENAVVYFNSVTGLKDYFNRFKRITLGVRQINKEFSQDRIKKCSRELHRELDFNKINNLTFSQKFRFYSYLIIRFIVKKLVNYNLKMKSKNYEWYRIKQDK